MWWRKKTPASPDPEDLGKWLALQMIGGNFDLADADLKPAAVPIEFDDLVLNWTVIYLGWWYCDLMQNHYGDEFRAAMVGAMTVGLSKVQAELGPKASGFSDTIQYWMDELSRLRAEEKRAGGFRIHDRAAPLEYFAALAFVVMDAGSPWHLDLKRAKSVENLLTVVSIAEAFVLGRKVLEAKVRNS